MSSTIIKALWPGEKQEDYCELRNSWGSGPVIWEWLAQRYLDYEPWTSLSKIEPIWKLAENENIPLHCRAVLMMTFDRAYVAREHYSRAAADIRRVLTDFPSPEGANHWPEIADLFQADPDIPAIGFRLTTVSDDCFWGEWDDDAEEHKPFDWDTAWEIYEELEAT